MAEILERAFVERTWRVRVCRVAGDPDGGVARLLSMARRVLGEGPAHPLPTLILLGDGPRQRRLAWALGVAGLRPAFRLIVHVNAERVPFDPKLADLFSLADLVVAESEVGIRAVRQCLEEGDAFATCPIKAIPRAVPREAAVPLSSEAREHVRRTTFGVGADELLVGCCAGTVDHHRSLLASQVFRALVEAGTRRTRARFYLSQPETTREPVGTRFPALEGRVLVDGVDLPRADSPSEILERLSCLDVHLQPHRFADVEAQLMASCALGIAAITTRFGAAEELLEGAARLVEPRITLDHSAGHRLAVLDSEAALQDLLGLARDPEARSRLGARAREAMRAHHESSVAAQWIDHLERLEEL